MKYDEIISSIAKDAKKAEMETLNNALQINLNRAKIKNFEKSNYEKFRQKQSKRFPHYFHKISELENIYRDFPEKVVNTAQKFLINRIGKTFSEKVKFDYYRKAFVSEYCPRVIDRGVNGEEIFVLYCNLPFDLDPPRFLGFRIFLRENMHVFPIFEIPDLLRNPKKGNIIPLDSVVEWLAQTNKIEKDLINEISFEYFEDSDCFAWTFSCEYPEPSYEVVVREIIVCSNELKELKTNDISLTHYR